MLKVFGKDYVCHDKAARLKAWAGAHSVYSDGIKEFAGRGPLLGVRGTLCQGRQLQPALYLLARRDYKHLDGSDAEENRVTWEACLIDTYKRLTDSETLCPAQKLIVQQIMLMDAHGSSPKALSWATTAVGDVVPYLFSSHTHLQAYTDIAATVTDRVLDLNLLEPPYPQLRGQVEACVYGDAQGDVGASVVHGFGKNLVDVVFTLDGVDTALTYLLQYDVMASALTGKLLMIANIMRPEPIVRDCRLSVDGVLDFVL